MKLVDLQFKLGEISGKIDQLLAQEAAREKRIDALEGRTRSLEVFRWKSAGAISVWALVLGALVTWINKHG